MFYTATFKWNEAVKFLVNKFFKGAGRVFICSTTDLGNLSIVDTFFGVYFCVCGGVCCCLFVWSLC